MGSPICPDCGALYGSDNINVAEGVALCGSCGSLSRLAELVDEDKQVNAVDLDNPPRGCTYRDDGFQVEIEASMHSVVKAIATLLFATFWNGVVSVFLFGVIGSAIQHFGGSVPNWLPFGSSQAMPPSMILFFALFLIPFVLIGIGSILALILTICGRVTVRIEGSSGCVATGTGSLSWRRRFDASQVQSVSIKLSSWSVNDQAMPQIVIDCGRKLKFGSQLTEERRQWMAAALCKILLDR